MRRWWLAQVGGVVAWLVLASAAAAAPPSCATSPPAYTGSDQTVAAIVQLDQDEDQNCTAVTARLDQLDSDDDTLLTQLHMDAQSIDSHVSAVNATLNGWSSSNPLSVQLPGGGSGQAVQVTNWPSSQPVSFDSTATGQLDGIGQSEHGDLWVLIGVVVACFLFQIFLAKVWP